MLLDPLEKQLDLPTALVQSGNVNRPGYRGGPFWFNAKSNGGAIGTTLSKCSVTFITKLWRITPVS